MLNEGKNLLACTLLACTGAPTHVSLHRLREVLGLAAMGVPPD
jgi:hypothetical protein